MAKTKSTAAPADKRTAVVRIARPADRPYYIWYRCPETNARFRLSTGTRDEAEAEEMRADLEAKVRLGLTQFKRSKVPGDHMSWEEFRWEYTNKRLSTLKPGSAAHADKRNKCATVVIHDPGSVAIATGPAPAPGGAAGLLLDLAVGQRLLEFGAASVGDRRADSCGNGCLHLRLSLRTPVAFTTSALDWPTT